MILRRFFFDSFDGLYQRGEFIKEAEFTHRVKLFGFIFGFFGHCELIGTELDLVKIRERKSGKELEEPFINSILKSLNISFIKFFIVRESDLMVFPVPKGQRNIAFHRF
eukprot:TRINITY_DN8872_c3_g1_i1.p2 TRINITY_DN8872_c3_g1~~TRINITY_DN8872_c3_g1_i1.p2  ORF type:complete len:109 (+),score=9.58 TRINITY_DN8872_c3_g1_i1:347-673(+)